MPPEPLTWWVAVDTERQCARCKTRIPSGGKARRTRGVERHMGDWLGECCG